MNPAFGIDFGTTNTRVAYFDGNTLQVVPFDTSRGRVYQFPTAIAYQQGKPVAFGVDALQQTVGVRFPKPLKWLLKTDNLEDIEGGTLDPVDIVADYLKHLKAGVEKRFPTLDRAAVTIPVRYPTDARRRLHRAFRKAGIAVSHFFYEPIAAMYAAMVGEPADGTMGVFDWGGGSLDIATVKVSAGIAHTRKLDGWDRGGTNFDSEIAGRVIGEFLIKNPDKTELKTHEILERSRHGHQLLLDAQSAKEDLRTQTTATITALNFLGIDSLIHPITRADLAEIIAPDLLGAMARFERVLADSEVSTKTLAKLFLSGGTCYLNDIQSRFARDFGNRVVGSLRLPPRFVGPNAGGLSDIGNATAIGAALLAAYGQAPVFSASIGVRLAGDRSGEQFHTVYNAGDPVQFDTPKKESFFISDASHGAGRLLICERHDAATEPAGRLIRMIPVPIHPSENWLDVTFTIDHHLTLNVKAIGRQNVLPEPSQFRHRSVSEDIPSLKLGFPLPV